MGELWVVDRVIPTRVSTLKLGCYLVLPSRTLLVVPSLYLASYESILLSITSILSEHSSNDPRRSTICLTKSPTVLPFSVSILHGTVSVVGTTDRTGT